MLMVWISIGIMAVLGIGFGVVLAIASKKFAVHMDPRAEQILQVLPQVNCGACGQKGCQDYAENVAKGEQPVDLCVPGGSATAKKVAEVMGLAYAGVHIPKRAVVHCQGGDSITVKEFVYSGIADCRSALLVQGGEKACKYGCLGYGTCSEACPYGAITMSADRLPEIDEGKCVACGLCVKACPRALITVMPSSRRVILGCSNRERGKAVKDACQRGCIACGICAKQSAGSGAVQLVDNLPVIDYEKWADSEQQVCIEKCPMKCYWRQPVAEEAVAAVEQSAA